MSLRGNLLGGVPPLDPLGWVATVLWPWQWILQLRFDGLRLSITKSVEEPELLLLYFLPLLNNSCVTQCLWKGECGRVDRNPKRNVWWGEWESRLPPPSAQLWHLPHLIWAFSPQVMMKRRCWDHPVKLSNLGVNEISTRDLQEARKLIFTFN